MGYVAGIRHSASQAGTDGWGPHASPADSAKDETQPVTRTGDRCSAQLGAKLQLGVEIVNRSAATATLGRVTASLPLHGLRAKASAWGSCGQISPVDTGTPRQLPPGATAWLTITFDVLVPCPTPIPVLLHLAYTQGDHTATADLNGFPDLGGVPYTRCTASPG
jgi:hypothetical protein